MQQNTHEAPVFSIEGLTKRYGKRTVVSELSFCGRAGEIVGFLGPNGAGKTTTIRMMTGLSAITEGHIEICGYDVTKEYEAAAACVGAVVETPVLYDYLTGSENLALFGRVKKCSADDVAAMAELSGLGKRLGDKAGSYSLGMKQRLGIAVALLGHPPLLILDEPTNGLDPLAIRGLRAFLKKLAHEEGTCILISSHMLWEMEKMCDRVVIVDGGVCLGEASLPELAQQGINLEDHYVSCVEKREGSAT